MVMPRYDTPQSAPPVGDPRDQGADPVVWAGPGDFGQPAAFDAKTGVAAPLLAGFSMALLGVVAQAPTSFRWPGAALLVLAVVVMVLVACVQFGFRGRAVLYTKADVESWGRLSHLTAADDERLRAAVQVRDMAQWRVWHRRSRVAYNFGIAVLGVGIALVLAPPGQYVAGAPLPSGEAAWRWAGFSLALLGAGLEVFWIAADELRDRARRPAKPDTSTDESAKRGATGVSGPQ
jgi:hypothetical protein